MTEEADNRSVIDDAAVLATVPEAEVTITTMSEPGVVGDDTPFGGEGLTLADFGVNGCYRLERDGQTYDLCVGYQGAVNLTTDSENEIKQTIATGIDRELSDEE